MGFSGGLAQGMGSSKGWVIGKRLYSGRRDGYGQGEEMVYPALNATGRFEKSNYRNIVLPPLELVKSQNNQLTAGSLFYL